MKKINIEYDKSLDSDLIKVIAKEDSEELRQITDLFEKKRNNYLLAFKNNQYFNIPIINIHRIFCRDSSVYIKVNTEEYEIKERLYEVELKTINYSFIKINKGELINIKQIKKFDLSITAKINVELKNGDISCVSRRNIKKIKEIIGL